VITRAERTVVLNLAGNTASLQENNYSANYLNALAQTTGANSRLWIKGGQGSVATIDLFGSEDLDGNNVPDQLDQIRDENWLINEANLTFYIDRVKMDTTVGQTSRAVEPQRIYLYDLTNRRPIVDYSADGTTAADPKKKKMIYGGLIERENVENGKGIRYKIRLTNYVNQLVKNADSTNIRLGLSVTEDTNTFSMVRLRNDNPQLKNAVPTASVMSPLGTVLYGTTAAQEDKRLKLEIYYTKPE